MKLKRIEVVPVGKYGWLVYDHTDPQRTRHFDKKRMAVSYARAWGYGLSVRIHNRKGRFQEERTYPRSADPKRRKG